MQLSNSTLPVIFVMTLLLTTLVQCAKDYYQILGVEKGATDRQIKRAFRKLAVKYHPDKNKDPDAEKQFMEIGKAYDVLSDPEKRKKYDQLGHATFEDQQTKYGNGGAGGFGGFDFKEFFKAFDESLRLFKTGSSRRQGQNNGRKGFKFNLGNDFWEDVDDDLLGGFGNFGFGGGLGDTFVNLHDFGFGGDLFGNGGHAHNAHQGGRSKSNKKRNDRSNCRVVTKKIGKVMTTYDECW